MNGEANTRTEGWHLDKRVPIGIIGAIIFQTLCVGWWAASISARQEDHERRLGIEERATEQVRDRNLGQESRLARIEEGVRSLLDTAQRLERRIDGNGERQR